MSPAYRTGLPCTCPANGGFSGMVLEGGIQIHVTGCQAVSPWPPAKLRVGDVVRTSAGREGRITGIVPEGAVFVDGGMLGLNEATLTLLRRPVQRGDRVRHRAWSKMEWPSGHEVTLVTPEGFGRTGAGCIDAVWADRAWIHADGTEIDPPQDASERATEPAPFSAEVQREIDELTARIKAAHDQIRSEPPEEPTEPPPGISVYEPPPTVDRLARALWETDVDAFSFVHEVAETGVQPLETAAERYRRCADVAWTRDELGLKSKWLARAEKVLAELGRRR